MVIRNLAAVVLLLLACAAPSPRPTVKVPPLAGKPLTLSAQDLSSGNEVRVEAHGRVVVVDFFASWCGPCRIQLPHLDQLARELGGEGLSVYGVAFDDEREAALGFAAEVGVRFPLLWDRGGDRLSGPLGIDRLPTTLIVDRRGVVRRVLVGYRSSEGGDVEAEVRALLAE